MYLQQRPLLEVAEALAPKPHGGPSAAAVLRVGGGESSNDIDPHDSNCQPEIEKVKICLADTKLYWTSGASG
jgi:hypothetical protein